MNFANPWGLLGLLAIPTILFIHLFQRRFPHLEIGGLHLWLDNEQVQTSGLRRDRLPITKTLILELLVAILLTTLLARPQLSDLNSTTHWVIVLDNSASMMAGPLNGKTFRDRAIDEIGSRIDETGRQSKVSIFLTGLRPLMLAGPAVSWQEARTALQTWQPQLTRHQFQAAWDTALQLADSTGKLVFITDHRKQDSSFPPKMEWVAVGESLSNLTFETARWSIDPQTLDANLYLRIRNHSDSVSAADIVGTSNGQELFRKSSEIRPGGSLPVSIALPGGIKSIDLTIESPADRLPTDSQLRLIEPGLRTVRYAIKLPTNHPAYLDVQKFFQSANNVQLTSDPGQADFVVSPLHKNDSYKLSEHAWQIAIGPADLNLEARKNAGTTAGPYLLDRRNQILEGVSLQGTIWSGYQAVDSTLAPLVSVGKKILFGQKRNSDHRHFVLDIDFASSNFSDGPDFPILFSNLVESCRSSKPGLRRWNYHLNEIVSFRIAADKIDDRSSANLSLIHEDGIKQLPKLSNVEIPPLVVTGEYEVKDGEQSLGRFAVNFFDSRESDLSGLGAGIVDPEQTDNNKYVSADLANWLWMLLIVLALAIAIWNWAGLGHSKPSQRVAREFSGGRMPEGAKSP